MSTTETVTLTVGSARIEVPAADVVQQILGSLVPGAAATATISAPAVHVRRHRPCIGHHWDEQGGIYAGVMRHVSGIDYPLVVAAGDEIEEIEWGSHGENEPGATGEWDGLANTVALIQSKHPHPAAEWTRGLNLHGHQDWYLFARREAALCYANVPELFAKSGYWTSTQHSAGSAWVQGFYDGNQLNYPKSDEWRARAVRRVFDHSAI